MTPISIPTLDTPRLRLRPPDAQAAAAYEAFYTDPQASHHYGGPLTPGQAWARLATDLGHWSLRGFGVWVIERKADRHVVGTCGYWQGLGWPRELTWWLLPSARGQGLALEASQAAITHALEAWHWPEVQTYMNDDNAAARTLALRLGGQRIGRQAFPDGRERDVFRLAPQAPPC